MDEEANTSSVATQAEIQNVFNQDLLRGIILDNAIYYEVHNNNHSKMRQRNLKSLRLVARNWVSTITKLLLKHKEPLYSVELRNNETWKEFANFFAGREETFKLTLNEEFFQQKNYKQFFSNLRGCVSGLVEFNVQLPQSGGSFPGILPIIGFPSLRKLRILLSSRSVELDEDNADGEYYVTVANTGYLIASLLNQCSNLKTLHITSNEENDTVVIVPGIQFCTLPASLAKLCMYFRMSNFDLKLLEYNMLPVLKELNLRVGYPKICPEILYKILQNVSATLESLILWGEQFDPQVSLETEATLKFPVMTKLWHLRLQKIRANLSGENASKMFTYFPVLSDLELVEITDEALRSWSENVSLPTACQLTLEMGLYNVENGQCVGMIPITNMPNFVAGMPNISKLRLHVQGEPNVMLLSLIFEHLSDINYLTLSLTSATGMKNADMWDSVLTGVPHKVVTALRKSPKFWDSFNINLANGNVSSIRSMKGLHTLELEDLTSNDGPSVISNLAFTCAFEQMPQLTTIICSGRFKASDDVALKWRNAGKTFVYVEK